MWDIPLQHLYGHECSTISSQMKTLDTTGRRHFLIILKIPWTAHVSNKRNKKCIFKIRKRQLKLLSILVVIIYVCQRGLNIGSSVLWNKRKWLKNIGLEIKRKVIYAFLKQVNTNRLERENTYRLLTLKQMRLESNINGKNLPIPERKSYRLKYKHQYSPNHKPNICL